jgi:glutamate dehydrogenase
MTLRSIKAIDKKIDNLIKNKIAKISKDNNFVAFTKLFYSKITHDDLLNRQDDYLHSLVKSSFDFFRQRKKDEIKFNIFTPKENSILGSKHSIIEFVASDMPFVVDSITAEITKHGYAIERIINRVINVSRDKHGKLVKICDDSNDDGKTNYESVIHIQISKIDNDKDAEKLLDNLKYVLSLVKQAVSDWHNILVKLNEVRNDLKSLNLKLCRDDLAESLAFLDWIEDNAFVFLGFSEYSVSKCDKLLKFQAFNESKLGMLKLSDPDDLKEITKDLLKTVAFENSLIEITKSENKSLIHRPAHLDIIRIKKYNHDGELIGEYRFFGLFTSVVFYQNAKNIPIIRKKIAKVISQSGFDLSSHNGKELVSVLAAYPREELFQINQEELFETAMGIVAIAGRSVSKLFARQDKFGRFASIICYVPKKNFSSGIREKIQNILAQEFNGEVTAHYTQISESILARVNFIVKITGIIPKKIDYQKIEREILDLSTPWHEKLLVKLDSFFTQDQSRKIFNIYKNAFSLSYIEHFSQDDAARDISVINNLLELNHPLIKLFQEHDKASKYLLKIYSHDDQITLSEIMPILENFGLEIIEEHTFKIVPKLEDCDKVIWLHNFKIGIANFANQDFIKIQEVFEDAILKCWLNKVENDSLNKLVLAANISAREVSLVRAYCRYLKQTKFPYGSEFVSAALHKNAEMVRLFIDLFYNKFIHQDVKKIKLVEAKILNLIAQVTNLSEDAVLRKFLELLSATLRTNFFQLSEGAYKDYISFKLSSKDIEDIPLPKPHSEIYVYSPTMEAIHLRGGKVARGGLRWSDRTEDFRTEVHGLVKAQMTKNAVIVPTGSKGGFVIKKKLAKLTREEYLEEGIEAYKIFLSGLLDLTDNIIAGKIVTPENIVRYDNDDPYLVVAADKGTATFSDIANQVSQKYNFWLGDAFASGGSQGYDHKKMGITAKGAWVSVTRHFYELGINIMKDNFTVVGIGDMSGDVFGNGMLLSQNIKLVAAFNHMHIFIDPNPDNLKSFKERQRLFKLSRSTWLDYDKSLISKGGGIFERSAKSIKLTKEIQKLLGVTVNNINPNDLIKYILKAPVDLLWNGGIGTYIKSSVESDAEVGDHANDAVRIPAKELNCRIIGEGGNLGLTQKGRIEYALNGGKINTDSIDNSAGVDCSDHEVNIKIALQAAMENKRLNIAKRNSLLEVMTEDVENLVLRDNFLQTQAISIAEYQGVKSLEQHDRMMRKLEKLGLLDRKVEFLPDIDEVNRRHSMGIGLTRPELSVLLSYSKIYLYSSLLSSTLPDEEYYVHELIKYFPEKLAKSFNKEVKAHNLRREIVATYITNSLVNRLGITFFNRLSEDTGLKMCDIARAYTITRDAFKLRDLWLDIQNLMPKIEANIQIEMYREIATLVESTTAWLIRGIEQPIRDIEKLVKEFSPKVEEVYNTLDKSLDKYAQKIRAERFQYYVSKKVPEKIAKRIASMDMMSSACQIVQVARNNKKVSIEYVAELYYSIGTRLHLRYLRMAAQSLKIDSYWDKLSLKSYTDNIYDQQMRITDEVVKYSISIRKKLAVKEVLDKWEEDNNKQISRFNELIYDLQTHDYPDFSMLNVAGNRIKEITSIS